MDKFRLCLLCATHYVTISGSFEQKKYDIEESAHGILIKEKLILYFCAVYTQYTHNRWQFILLVVPLLVQRIENLEKKTTKISFHFNVRMRQRMNIEKRFHLSNQTLLITFIDFQLVKWRKSCTNSRVCIDIIRNQSFVCIQNSRLNKNRCISTLTCIEPSTNTKIHLPVAVAKE